MMSTYLTRKGTEVRNMFFGEYDYDLDMKVKAQEAVEEKAEEAAINLLKMNKLSVEDIAQAQGLSLEKVLELQKKITVQA